MTYKDISNVAFDITRKAPAELLLGFFDFFNKQFDWTKEVVSVRMGERRTIDDACFRNFWGKGRKLCFHVEDPIATRKRFEHVTFLTLSTLSKTSQDTSVSNFLQSK